MKRDGMEEPPERVASLVEDVHLPSEAILQSPTSLAIIIVKLVF